MLFCQGPQALTLSGDYPLAHDPSIAKGGTQLLTANSRWLGPGGASVMVRVEGDLIVFHAYDAITGKPALQISTLTWEGGWPHAALGTAGESR